jgi:hypothetical protein
MYVLIIQHFCTLVILLLTLNVLQIPKLATTAYQCVWGVGEGMGNKCCHLLLPHTNDQKRRQVQQQRYNPQQIIIIYIFKLVADGFREWTGKQGNITEKTLHKSKAEQIHCN